MIKNCLSLLKSISILSVFMMVLFLVGFLISGFFGFITTGDLLEDQKVLNTNEGVFAGGLLSFFTFFLSGLLGGLFFMIIGGISLIAIKLHKKKKNNHKS